LQSDRKKHEELNDAVISNRETISDIDNDDQISGPDQKSNSFDSNEMMMRNNATMVFNADFCRDGIVDDSEAIDAKRMTKNDDLMTENDDRNNKSDLRGIAEEIKEETEFLTETMTSFSELTEKTMEITTMKCLNKKEKKKKKKMTEIAMVIAQQQNLIFGEEIVSNNG